MAETVVSSDGRVCTRCGVFKPYRYGISPDEMRQMHERQNGCCAICGTPEAELKRRLCIDHDHETGKVRGLLCDPCNNGIARFKEDVDSLRAAAAYLESHQSKENN